MSSVGKSSFARTEESSLAGSSQKESLLRNRIDSVNSTNNYVLTKNKKGSANDSRSTAMFEKDSRPESINSDVSSRKLKFIVQETEGSKPIN